MSLGAAKIGKKLGRQASRAGIVLLALTLASCAGSSDPWWDSQYDYRSYPSASSSNSFSGPAARPRPRPQSQASSGFVRNAATPVARPSSSRPSSSRPRSRDAIAARVHVVKPGETVYRISSMYKVEQGALKSANGIGPDNSLRVGQRLSIPGGQPQNTRVAAAPARPSTGAPTPRTKPALPTPPPVTGDFIWPAEGRIISRFGPKADGLHNDGINIAVPEGTPVRAAQSGVVAYAGNELRGYGNLLLVRHSNGWMTAYAHNGELLVQRGATVTKGQTIALAGRTGSVQTAQVHFEIRRGSQALDPIKAMSG
ncbi:MAG: LysM peptidoglycan-binding domain-containing M23 family metallopeptidase [Rhodobiaceae bacterium]|nr:LysM peptidoglycan-binding domain-containing M23 family metallopeptidase [Rhodobiaceae bacterium]